MSGITSGTGIFSGVNSADLIEQLLAVDARPKTAMQRRSSSLSLQQTVFRDFNSKLSNMKSILRGIREAKTFRAAKAVSNNEAAIKATASNNAAAGSYEFTVDRLVSTQQMLSRGFGDRDTAGLGATRFTVESTLGRLDRDTPLSELNGGAGVARGKVVITDSANNTATVDLSRVASISEVVEAINSNGTARVNARVVDDKLVLTDRAGGGGTMNVANAAGFTTATSLGIAGTASGGTLSGSSLISLSNSTLLSTLNDSNGIAISQTSTPSDYSIRIAVGSTNVNVNLGDVWQSTPGSDVNTKVKSAVTTVGGVIERINEALTAAGVTTASASIGPDGKRLRLTDSNNAIITVTNSGSTQTAEMLGLAGTGVTAANGSVSGRRVLSGMATTLASSLNGGSGIGGNGVVDITARDGTSFSVNIDQNASLAQIAASIESASGTISGGPKISVRVNDKGTGLAIVDNTGGSSNLIVRGTDGDDTAAALGIATSATGVASASIQGSNLQRQYVSSATLLSSLNNGKGVGTGTMRLTDATGTTANITLSSTTRTVEDMIKQLNASGLAISASLNSQGDGIVLTSTSNATGKIKVEDTSGQVAKNLNLAGEAKGSGVLNTIDGSFERQIEFSAADSLSTVASKINSANAGVVAAIVNDGSTAAPFRLNLTASTSGASGRFQIDTNGFDLGLTTMQSGQDSRVFFGSSDPARGLLLTSSTNTVDNAIQGVKLDLLATTTSSVMINVSRDSGAIEAKIDEFITAYNALSDSIKAQSSYDTESKRAGPLLGDGTTIALRQTMTSTIQGRPIGVTPRFNRVGEIGIKVAKDGKLEFNKDKFREAVAQDADSVERMLFARVQTNLGGVRDLGGGASVIDPDQPDQFSELGIFTQFEEMATRYIDSTRGILTGKDKSITSLTENISKQIAALDSRIASKRVVLQQQFLRMEKTIGRLQSQQSSLASMSG
ncbi:MAG: flagellar filament capping protein FliD [Tepidisphaera sp.]